MDKQKLKSLENCDQDCISSLLSISICLNQSKPSFKVVLFIIATQKDESPGSLKVIITYSDFYGLSIYFIVVTTEWLFSFSDSHGLKYSYIKYWL